MGKHRFLYCRRGPFPHTNQPSNLDRLLATIDTPILEIKACAVQPAVGLGPGWQVKTMVRR
jgi:hypothetical protein